MVWPHVVMAKTRFRPGYLWHQMYGPIFMARSAGLASAAISASVIWRHRNQRRHSACRLETLLGLAVSEVATRAYASSLFRRPPAETAGQGGGFAGSRSSRLRQVRLGRWARITPTSPWCARLAGTRSFDDRPASSTMPDRHSARAFEQFDPFWLRTRPDDYERATPSNRRTGLRIAAGEKRVSEIVSQLVDGNRRRQVDHRCGSYRGAIAALAGGDCRSLTTDSRLLERRRRPPFPGEHTQHTRFARVRRRRRDQSAAIDHRDRQSPRRNGRGARRPGIGSRNARRRDPEIPCGMSRTGFAFVRIASRF